MDFLPKKESFEVPADIRREHQKKIDSLRKINDLIEKKDPERLLMGQNAAAVNNFILSNIKQTFKAVANSLSAHEIDPRRHPSEG